MTPAQASEHINLLYGNPLDVISWSLRSMLTAAPGYDLISADFANIEGRGLAWLAGEEWKLKAYREFDAGTGPDLYLLAASRIYNKSVEECRPFRQTGKTSDLSLGYGGGLGAFRQMERTLGLNLHMSDDEVEAAKKGWRKAHPRVVNYWSRPWDEPNAPPGLENAAMEAVLNPGKTTMAGAPGRQVKYRKNGSFLWALRPSGGTMCYPYPKILPIETPWGAMKDALTYMKVIGDTTKAKEKIVEDPANKGKWQRVSTYGGGLSADSTQGFCRDILAATILRLRDAGYHVVLHVHDEPVSEVLAGTGDLKEYERLCSVVPDFAPGMLIVAKGWRGKRFRK